MSGCVQDLGTGASCVPDSAQDLGTGASCVPDSAQDHGTGASCVPDSAQDLGTGASCVHDSAQDLGTGASCVPDGAQVFGTVPGCMSLTVFIIGPTVTIHLSTTRETLPIIMNPLPKLVFSSTKEYQRRSLIPPPVLLP